jgi:hypothetical protein
LIGGDFSEERIAAVRGMLQLLPGEYLSERDAQVMARGLLGRMRV